MSDQQSQRTDTFAPPADFAARAHIKSLEQYESMYQRSIDDPEGFWAEMADQFYWHKKWDQVRSYDWRDIADTLKKRADSGGMVVINQDIYLVDPIGARFADIIFPAATWRSWFPMLVSCGLQRF